MSEYKPLVIKVKSEQIPQGVEGEWKDFTSQMPTFTKDIITPDISKDADASAIVSGVPTIFARANLFSTSIDYVQDKKGSDIESSSLMQFYATLVDEWRGFIACIALDYSKIRIRRIYLDYSDGKDLGKTINIYEPKGAFGNMLFERRPLWCEQNKNENEKKTPFIDVIKYDGNLVGATSPDSLLFTSVNYGLNVSKPFVNIKTKRFTDPLHSELSLQEANQLYAYVKHLYNNIHKFKEKYSSLPEDIQPQYSCIEANIKNWIESIKKYMDNKGFKVSGVVPPVTCFKEPFDILFNFSSALYGMVGEIYEDPTEGSIKFDPVKLLLPEGTEIARIRLIEDKSFTTNDIPICLLKANVKNENSFAYFALPLSPIGLNVFGEKVESLVGQDTSIPLNSSLRAVYDKNSDINNLSVTLTLITDKGVEVTTKVEYTANTALIQRKDLKIWPNFISKQWNRYFLYSEMPHNVSTNECPFRATPFLGNINDDYFRILSDETNTPIYVAKEGQISIPKNYESIKAELLITSDNRIADNPYKYEIYESNIPFKGVRLTAAGRDSGFLLIRYSSNSNSGLPKKYLSLPKSFYQANLGIDFGSTNTSIAYFAKEKNSNPVGIILKNHTVSLLDFNKKNANHVAMENDIFFFQSEEMQSNAIKSILTLHDKRRLVQSPLESGDMNRTIQKEIKGGFPCFEKNLPVDTIDEGYIKLNYKEIGQNSGEVYLIHNMKWKDREEDKSYKQAFLRTLLLHVYAELFEQDVVPVKIKWSYPSSMGHQLLSQYKLIWESLSNICPVLDLDHGNPYRLVISAITNTISSLQNETGNIFSNTAKTSEMPSFESNNNFGDTNFSQNPFEPTPSDSSDFSSNCKSSINVRNDDLDLIDSIFGDNSSKMQIADLKPDNGPIKFNFRPIDLNASMTEACAVANYIMSQKTGPSSPDDLTLCFDIGGSTTDISALCKTLDGSTVMIKQNSIRFAAQRVSMATRYSPHFKDVLNTICANNNLYIEGLTHGEDKYNSDTAPYYFEQIVDGLDSDKFPELYSLISAKCPELMSVNLYVTGLIIYYAGQLIRKIVSEVRRSKDKDFENRQQWLPNVHITFAGKGSRIFEWFHSTAGQSATQYYVTLLLKGLGGNEATQYIRNWRDWEQIIIVKKEDASDVKYEVSKGLALNNTGQVLRIPQNDEVIEILGEDNFKIISPNGEETKLNFDNSITSEMLENIGGRFQGPSMDGNVGCTRFQDFAGLFFQTATKFFKLPMSKQDFMEGFINMNINQSIVNLQEYRDAKIAKNVLEGKFDFVAPIIIIEGMKFYDDYLIKCLNRNNC